jgi:hypothetical protein
MARFTQTQGLKLWKSDHVILQSKLYLPENDTEIQSSRGKDGISRRFRFNRQFKF